MLASPGYSLMRVSGAAGHCSFRLSGKERTMNRFRIALLAVFATLALGAVSVPVASASNGTTVPPKLTSIPPLYTVQNVHGVAKNGKNFSGTYGIYRFLTTTVNGKRGVYAIGTLKGKLGSRPVTRYGVMIPAKLAGAPAGAAQTAAQTCPVLSLELGPINLNLLGLNVALGGGTITPGQRATEPITLNITAQQNGGLLGNLLCGLDNALSGGTAGSGLLSQLNSQLGQLTGTLNAILGLLGGGAPTLP